MLRLLFQAPFFYLNYSTIELCTAIATYPEYVCSLFPSDVPCSCPLAASVYRNPSAYVTFTSEWLAIDGGVNVSDDALYDPI